MWETAVSGHEEEQKKVALIPSPSPPSPSLDRNFCCGRWLFQRFGLDLCPTLSTGLQPCPTTDVSGSFYRLQGDITHTGRESFLRPSTEKHYWRGCQGLWLPSHQILYRVIMVATSTVVLITTTDWPRRKSNLYLTAEKNRPTFRPQWTRLYFTYRGLATLNGYI